VPTGIPTSENTKRLQLPSVVQPLFADTSLIVVCGDLGAFRQPIVALDQSRTAAEPGMSCYWRRKGALSLRDMTGTDYRLVTHLAFDAVLILR
jgi:hypothetical protein